MLTKAIPLLMDSLPFAEMLSALCRHPEFFSKLCQDFFFNVVEPYGDAA